MSIIFKLIAKFPNITDIGSMETKKIFVLFNIYEF